MYQLPLNGSWKLRAEFLDIGPERAQEVIRRFEGPGRQEIALKNEHRINNLQVFPKQTGSLVAQVPCDVLTPLVDNGLIEEPLLKSNTEKSIWTKDLSWWFMREFEVSETLLDHDEVRLYIEMLDHKADLILNGVPFAHHRNTFRPFEMDIKPLLQAGHNQLLIRLTCGLEDYYPRNSITYYCATDSSTVDQRIYLRKPQFTFGWDWCKPVPTCGIGRDIRLQGFSGARIVSFRADTLAIREQQADLEIFFALEKSDICTSEDAVLEYSLLYQGEIVFRSTSEHHLVGGMNYVSETIKIDCPHLWWPNQYGQPDLYQVHATITCRGIASPMQEKSIGIRTVSLAHDRLDDGTRRFDFLVNGVRIFCKGGNWVPTDSVYLRTPDQTYKTLVEEARQANFTMLRMWGGGTYEPDCFYQYCSEAGILLMHDFMYSCAYYPDHLDWFAYEARLEADYQTRRLAHYPCMAVWTGNNEIHEAYTDWFVGDVAPPWRYGGKIFNYIQPEAVRAHSPRIPYMPSSPYFGQFNEDIAAGKITGMSKDPHRGKNANSPIAGDVHAWTYFYRDEETRMKFRFELEAFDRFVARFSSEFGFHGAMMESSFRRCLDGGELKFNNPDFIHHGEDPRKRAFMLSAMDIHLVDQRTLDEQAYLLYSGVLQGCLYRELAEAMRMKAYGSGNLIWMYNDCWPETGWTIIDYYLTRKISFYFLKRAFAPKILIIRADDQRGLIKAINETPDPVTFQAQWGYMDVNGQKKNSGKLTIKIAPHSDWEYGFDLDPALQDGFYYVWPDADIADEWAPASSVRAYYRARQWPTATLSILESRQDGSDLLLRLGSDAYVPVAWLKFSDDRIRLSDNYFPLLPGEEKVVRVFDSHEIPSFEAVAMQPQEEQSTG